MSDEVKQSEPKKVDDVDRLKLQVLVLKLQGTISDYKRAQETKKRAALEEVVLAEQVQALKAEHDSVAKAVLAKYEIEDFDLETGLEVKPSK